MLRLRDEDRCALLTAPLSMTGLFCRSACMAISSSSVRSQGYIWVVPTTVRNEGNPMRGEIDITGGWPFL
jgi:hypothetical protein